METRFPSTPRPPGIAESGVDCVSSTRSVPQSGRMKAPCAIRVWHFGRRAVLFGPRCQSPVRRWRGPSAMSRMHLLCMVASHFIASILAQREHSRRSSNASARVSRQQQQQQLVTTDHARLARNLSGRSHDSILRPP